VSTYEYPQSRKKNKKFKVDWSKWLVSVKRQNLKKNENFVLRSQFGWFQIIEKKREQEEIFFFLVIKKKPKEFCAAAAATHVVVVYTPLEAIFEERLFFSWRTDV
jgi:hypothetical protein